jgi:hypothetical protein
MQRWFSMVGPEIQDIPDVSRFNADEIMLANGKHRKVAVSSEAHPFYQKTKKLPHHTLVVCFNRFGQGPTQLLVLPGLQNVPPEVQELERRELLKFETSNSGWCGTPAWRAFTRGFCEFANQLRETSDDLDGESWMVLFIDGAAAHIDLESLETFVANRVMVITFVPHSTGVQQPIDVNFARQFKVDLSTNHNELSKPGGIEAQMEPHLIPFKTAAARLRATMAHACASAVQSTLCMRYCSKAFDTCGLSQRHWDGGRAVWEPGRKPGVNQATDGSDPEEEARQRNPERLWTGSTVLTSPAFLAKLRVKTGQDGEIQADPPLPIGPDGDVDLELPDADFNAVEADPQQLPSGAPARAVSFDASDSDSDDEPAEDPRHARRFGGLLRDRGLDPRRPGPSRRGGGGRGRGAIQTGPAGRQPRQGGIRAGRAATPVRDDPVPSRSGWTPDGDGLLVSAVQQYDRSEDVPRGSARSAFAF